MLLPLLWCASITIDTFTDEHRFESGIAEDYPSGEQAVHDSDPNLEQPFGLGDLECANQFFLSPWRYPFPNGIETQLPISWFAGG